MACFVPRGRLNCSEHQTSGLRNLLGATFSLSYGSCGIKMGRSQSLKNIAFTGMSCPESLRHPCLGSRPGRGTEVASAAVSRAIVDPGSVAWAPHAARLPLGYIGGAGILCQGPASGYVAVAVLYEPGWDRAGLCLKQEKLTASNNTDATIKIPCGFVPGAELGDCSGPLPSPGSGQALPHQLFPCPQEP